MAQRSISIWEGRLGELATRARAVCGRGRSQWRLSGFDLLAIGVFFALTIFVLVRASGRPAHAAAPPAKASTIRRSSPSALSHRTRNSPAAALVARAHLPVLVLNGNGISGAAARSAQTVRAHGYPVTATADDPQTDYPHSVVMYKPGFAREAKRLGRDLHIPTRARLEPLALPGGTRARLIIIVGRGDD